MKVMDINIFAIFAYPVSHIPVSGTWQFQPNNIFAQSAFISVVIRVIGIGNIGEINDIIIKLVRVV
jgi:hypothetical protein